MSSQSDSGLVWGLVLLVCWGVFGCLVGGFCLVGWVLGFILGWVCFHLFVFVCFCVCCGVFFLSGPNQMMLKNAREH